MRVSTRIDRRFVDLAKEGRGGLIAFATAGDPDDATSRQIMHGLPDAGADIIELGMPFSDPMADGPAIQASSLRALAEGANLGRTLAMVRDFRRADDRTPVVLMGYYNPIYVFGVEAFLAAAAASGVDGLIAVDLPAEEEAELCLPALEAGISFIALTAPTTGEARMDRPSSRRPVGFRLLRLHHRYHRHPVCGHRPTSEKAVKRIRRHTRIFPSALASASRRRSKRLRDRVAWPTPPWSDRRSSIWSRWRRTSTRRCVTPNPASPRRRPVTWWARPGGGRPNGAGAKVSVIRAMNWLKNFVRPKLREARRRR